MTPVELLDAIAAPVASQPRRTAVGPPWPYTAAYVDFMVAYGCARLGEDEPAQRRMRAAYTGLAGVAADPVHAYLVAAFTTRIDQAHQGLPARPTPVLERQLASLDRHARYKVDRLREASRILEPLERPNAIERWKHGRDEVSKLPELPVEERVAAIREIVARDDGDHHALHDAIEALAVLSFTTAIPLVRASWRAISHVPEDERGLLYVKTMEVAEQLGQPQLVSEALDYFRASIPNTTHGLGQTLEVAVPIASRNGLRREMVEILITTEAATISNGAGPARIMIAGGMAALGEHRFARTILDETLEVITTHRLTPVARLDLICTYALAAAELPESESFTRIHALAAFGASATDPYGTNTHFCVSALRFVDSLVAAIVACARPRG